MYYSGIGVLRAGVAALCFLLSLFCSHIPLEGSEPEAEGRKLCTFLASAVEKWALAAQAQGGKLSRLDHAYMVSFEGLGFQSYTVKASACNRLSMVIDIKEVASEQRRATLQKAAVILTSVDQTFFNHLKATLLLLGDEIDELYVNSPLLLEVNAQAVSMEDQTIDIRISVSQQG